MGLSLVTGFGIIFKVLTLISKKFQPSWVPENRCKIPKTHAKNVQFVMGLWHFFRILVKFSYCGCRFRNNNLFQVLTSLGFIILEDLPFSGLNQSCFNLPLQDLLYAWLHDRSSGNTWTWCFSWGKLMININYVMFDIRTGPYFEQLTCVWFPDSLNLEWLPNWLKSGCKLRHTTL